MIPTDLYQAQGATLANDGIPLHFGDQRREYRAALDAAVLMDRSHEGRFEISGRDRLDLMHRISTNDLLSLSDGAGRPTIFTNPNARILDRALVFNRGDRALVHRRAGARRSAAPLPSAQHLLQRRRPTPRPERIDPPVRAARRDRQRSRRSVRAGSG